LTNNEYAIVSYNKPGWLTYEICLKAKLAEFDGTPAWSSKSGPVTRIARCRFGALSRGRPTSGNVCLDPTREVKPDIAARQFRAKNDVTTQQRS